MLCWPLEPPPPFGEGGQLMLSRSLEPPPSVRRRLLKMSWSAEPRLCEGGSLKMSGSLEHCVVPRCAERPLTGPWDVQQCTAHVASCDYSVKYLTHQTTINCVCFISLSLREQCPK